MVDILIESGAKLFVSAVGVPPKAVVDKLHKHGVVYMNMVGHPKHVQKCLDIGCDIICAQGGEGGGRIVAEGTPEEVWQAIATGPGISSWYVPHTVEEREGGAATASFGPGPEMTVPGRVAAWEPPRRIVFDGGEGVGGAGSGAGAGSGPGTVMPQDFPAARPPYSRRYPARSPAGVAQSVRAAES